MVQPGRIFSGFAAVALAVAQASALPEPVPNESAGTAEATRASTARIGAAAGYSQSVQSVQLPGTPPRDRAPVRQVGTGAIAGRVVDGITGQPIVRARVRLNSPAGRRPLVTTDGSGRFAFADLPPGPWSLMIERSSYMPTRYPEAGRSLRRGMRPPVLLDGQVVDTLTVPMYRGGVIAGRVVDIHGEPVEHAQVQLLRLPSSGIGPPSMRSGSGANDIGEFRMARLEPGTYLVLALPRGRPLDEADELQPVPTFYPGVLAADQAQPIVVERSTAVTDLEFVLLEGVGALVRGTVLGTDGLPFSGGGYVNARTVTDGVFGNWSVGGTNIRPDGTFQLRLTPGEYLLDTHVMPRSTGGPPRQEDEQVGSVRLTIAAGGMADVTISVGPGGTISGRFVFEGTDTRLPDPQQVRLSLQQQEDATCRPGRYEAAADWTFKITGVSGTCLPTFGGTQGWTVKAVMAGDENILDRPITFEPGQQLHGVRAILTDRRTELVLQVSDDTGQPTRDYVALVFPTDTRRWKVPGRYVRTYVPPPSEYFLAAAARSQPGPRPGMPSMPPTPHAMMAGLTAGEYYVVAVEDLDVDDAQNPAILRRLANHAVRVSLHEGSRAEVLVKRLNRF